MSIPLCDRTENKLEVLVRLEELCSYTIDRCKDEKAFPKRDRWILTAKIAGHAIDAYTFARKANRIVVKKHEDYMLRRGYQQECYCSLDALDALITIAYDKLNESGVNVEHWTKLIMNAEALLAKWRKSDSDRFRDVE